LRLCAARPGADAAERLLDADWRRVEQRQRGRQRHDHRPVGAAWHCQLGHLSIGSGATVNVRQPNASAVLLNRVTGESMSSIDGALNANGHVYLINPNGILFGQARG
jgi:filamentous hemagglutinin family protein